VVETDKEEYSMANTYTIRILETETNKMGDLFGRLMVDLFLSLGYEECHLNIHKSGREIDLEGRHRTEKRRVIAECKATKDNIGGDDINKFVGSLDVERRKDPTTTITGYFISLSGFKETANEQEKDAGGDRITLLCGNRVVDELIKGHIIVPLERAIDQAGRCAAEEPSVLKLETTCELLAHEIGWIWAIYFTMNKQRTHFALIHADGEAIASALAEKIIQTDKLTEGIFHGLKYIAPKTEALIYENQILEAKTKYFKYLAEECGGITLEGLPADQEVGSRRIDLENIFVPLYLEEVLEHKEGVSLPVEEEPEKVTQKDRHPVGKILSENSRLAILASPGGGKTTLLKRLVLAYAFPERSELINDNLPKRSWFPLLIRCRQLSNLVESTITDALNGIVKRAEITDLDTVFMLLVKESLRSGNALLLIDGLDEISNEGDRLAFIHQLCTFLAVYPTVNVIVTSREAGFRVVGGALSGHCKHYKIADFDDEDIKNLTQLWHKVVVGDTQEVRLEAENLAKTICESDRVRRLAQNPLLLTTLLLVKRWIGQLPTRRSVLYGKAIEVLLMTWNVQGHEPLDTDEVIPQLAFIAFAMMKDGVQRISSKRLRELLVLSRNQMPEVLGYAKVGIPEFIQRVELRSSLLILSGHEIEDGTLYQMYEFQHLTFQEYLTAKAAVDGYYPNRSNDDTLLKILESHLQDERWKEVVPLAAVLAGRNVQDLVRHLIDLCKKTVSDYRVVSLLAQCLIDEIQVAPGLLEEGLEWVARRTHSPSQTIRDLYRSKYSGIYSKVIHDAYMSSETDLAELGGALGDIVLSDIGWTRSLSDLIVKSLEKLLESDDPVQKAKAALAIMGIAYAFSSKNIKLLKEEKRQISAGTHEALIFLGSKLVPVLHSDDFHLHFAACWAFAWLGEGNNCSPDCVRSILPRSVELWKKSSIDGVHRQSAWVISALPIIDRDLDILGQPDIDLIQHIKAIPSRSKIELNRFDPPASLIISYYYKLQTDEELANKAMETSSQYEYLDEPYLHRILEALGEPGKVKLKLLDEKRKSRKLRKEQKKEKK
jgi:hypothetical protein